MKIIALLINLVWIIGMVAIIKSSGEGFEFKNQYIPILVLSFVSVIFLNIKVFKIKKSLS